MTKYRNTTLLALVLRNDPEHNVESRITTEYEFTSGSNMNQDDRTHERGLRVFKGDYQKRGPYAP